MPERVIGGKGLGICDVERRACEMPFLHHFDEIFRDDGVAAPDVQEVGAFFHRSKALFVEDAPRRRCPWQNRYDDIRTCEQRIEFFHRAHLVDAKGLRSLAAAHADDISAERLDATREGTTNVACAENQDGRVLD